MEILGIIAGFAILILMTSKGWSVYLASFLGACAVILLAGLPLEETLAKSQELGQAMQGMYSSWDEMVESYLDGYSYWAEEDPEDPESYTAQRRKIYEELKAAENSCFHVAWDTELKLEG